MKRILLVIGLSAVLISTWLVIRTTTDSERRIAPPETVIVSRRDISSAVLAMGIVRPMVGAEVKVGSRISGVVTRLQANIGDRVRAGDVLAELDDTELQVRLEQNLAGLVRAEAERALAQRKVERLRTIQEHDVIPVQDLDAAESARQVAESQVRLSEANVALSRIQLSYTRITAPISGVIASVSTQEGETVAASLASPTFVSMIDLERLEVQAFVDETDIGRIRVGQQAHFTVDTYPGESFSGEVTAIYPKAVIQDNVVNYVVTVRIEDRPGLVLRPEMTAAVTIVLEPRTDVLAVPTSAIGRDRTERFVTVLEQGAVVRRTVRTGWTQGGWTEIVEGLREGEYVVLPRTGELQP